MFEKALAARHDIEIIARSAWNAGYTLVAEKFQRGRIFLGGDAVHLFTPAGGLGYNTAIEDAVNLGWKLNAVLQGWGGPALLDSYETERQAIARRNTSYARGFADSMGLFVPPPELEDDSPAGEAARKLTGDHFNHHARFEFNIPGITFGGRYDGSPIIVPDGTAPPPDKVNTYEATACPGGRAPHLWLADGRSLYDALGFEFTLLALGGKPVDTAPFRAAAEALAMPLSVVPIEGAEARDLYGADLALIRPDQIVAWRGNSATDATAVLRRVTGHLGVVETLGPRRGVFAHHRHVALADQGDRGLGVAERRCRPGPVFELAGVEGLLAPERQPAAQPARLECVAQRVRHVPRAAERDRLAGGGAAHLVEPRPDRSLDVFAIEIVREGFPSSPAVGHESLVSGDRTMRESPREAASFS